MPFQVTECGAKIINTALLMKFKFYNYALRNGCQ